MPTFSLPFAPPALAGLTSLLNGTLLYHVKKTDLFYIHNFGTMLKPRYIFSAIRLDQ